MCMYLKPLSISELNNPVLLWLSVCLIKSGQEPEVQVMPDWRQSWLSQQTKITRYTETCSNPYNINTFLSAHEVQC